MAPKSFLVLETTRAGSWIRTGATKCFFTNERRTPGTASPSTATSLRGFPRELGLKPRVLGSLSTSGDARNPGEFGGFLLREIIPCSGCAEVGCRRLSPRTRTLPPAFFGGKKAKIEVRLEPVWGASRHDRATLGKGGRLPSPYKNAHKKNPVWRRGQPHATPHPSHPAPGPQKSPNRPRSRGSTEHEEDALLTGAGFLGTIELFSAPSTARSRG